MPFLTAEWRKLVLINYIVDFELNYGKKFAHLTKQTPDSVFLMEGSKITVEPKKSLTKF